MCFFNQIYDFPDREAASHHKYTRGLQAKLEILT